MILLISRLGFYKRSVFLQVIIISFLFTLTSPFIFAQLSSFWDQIDPKLKKKKSFIRYEEFFRKRALPEERFPADKFSTVLENQVKIDQQASNLEKRKIRNSWTPIGPTGLNITYPSIWGVCSGRIRGLAVHPTNPDIVYAGAASGGLWKTTNGGTSWTEVSNAAFAAISFGAITIDPNSPNTVYAGTGEARGGFNATTFNGDGLYKSTDAGATWTRITVFGTSTQFSAIKVSPYNSNVLLASIAQGYWKLGYPASAGVWQSLDAGINWSKVFDTYDAFDVAFDVATPNRAYAAVGGSGTTAGFFVSSDNGATFNMSSNGLPTTSQIGRIQIAQAPSLPTKIFSLIYRSDEVTPTTELYVSENSGETWTQLAPGVQFAGTYDGTSYSDQGSYDLCISVAPDDPNNVLIGNVELSRSTNGTAFTPVRNGGETAWYSACHVDYHVIVFSPSSPSIVYLGCDGGVFKSTDAGATWRNVNNGLSTIQFYRLASHPVSSAILHGGAQDNGNFGTNDLGTTNWVTTQTGDGMETFYSISGDTLYASTQNGALSRRDGAAGNFYRITPAWTGKSTVWTAPFFRHPFLSSTIYTANDYLWKSTDAGENWSRTSTDPVATARAINSVAQSSVNPKKLAASASFYTNAPELYVTSDEGVNWTSVSANLPAPTVWIDKVKFHPVEENTLFAVLSGFQGARVLRSTDFGATWENIGANLPQIPCSDIFVDPVLPDNYYVANDFGVYWSGDKGVSYTRLGDGMPYVPVIAFSYFSNSGTRLLRAATHGRGAYQLRLDSGVSTFAVKGKLTYANSSATPLPNISIILKSPTATIDSAKTDINGNYSFNSVPNGNYTFEITKFPVWGGVNSTDALMIRRYLAGLITFNSLQIKAADVNGSSTINSTDALLIRRRLASLDSTFKAGDWAFEIPDIIVNNGNVSFDLNVLCSGDVNGSYNPPVFKKSGAAPFINKRIYKYFK